MTKTPRCEGAGQGESLADSPDTATDPRHQGPVDVRLVLALRIAARLDLFEQGVLSIDEIFDAEIVGTFLSITGCCWCHRAQIEHFDREHRQLCEHRLRQWRWGRPR